MIDLAIDFDGTCVYHEYPEVGEDNPGAVQVLKDLVYEGHNLILYTMRSDEYLDDAVAWFKKNNIPLYGIQMNPTQYAWTKTNKCHAQIYIDDAALGCPLITADITPRPFVNWNEIRTQLKERGVL